jgi:hypothetical protein
MKRLILAFLTGRRFCAVIPCARGRQGERRDPPPIRLGGPGGGPIGFIRVCAHSLI